MSDADPAPASEEELDALFESLASAVRLADRPAALRLAVHAVQHGLEEPLALVLAAEAATDTGRFDLALGYLRKAAAINPDEAETWRRLGETLVAIDKVEEAYEALNQALRLKPDFGPNLVAAAKLDFQRGDLLLAETRYEAAFNALPDAPEPLEGLAAVAARRGESARARSFAGLALEHPGATVGAHLTLCRTDLLDGEPRPARTRLDNLLSQPDLSTRARIAALDLRAEAFDAMDEVEGAFSDYAQRNRLIELDSLGAPWRLAERPVDQARRTADFLRASDTSDWREAPGEDWEGALKTRAHVFLMGFPRSGTTLLEKTLATHPMVTTMEEVDHLGAAGGDLLQDAHALASLKNMTPSEANQRRLIYWRGVRETMGASFAGRVLVDKLPLHTLALPVIGRLFPNARVLFAIRDPRDVVLSCFRRRFALNAAMAEFLHLDRAAAFYDAVMGMAREARRILPLRVLEVRMERMIFDFDLEAARALGFLGLKWEDGVGDFAERARRYVRTPSDLQLLEGLNGSGVGQWRRYASALEAVLPVLQPWVERHGY